MSEHPPISEMSRSQLVAELKRVNPFGGYCVKPCKHPGHSDDAYRRSVARLRELGES